MTGEPAPFVLLDDRSPAHDRAYLYRNPEHILRCDEPQDVPAALAALDAGLAAGYHAAGYGAYELGYVLEPRLRPLLPPARPGPLLWFGLFREQTALSGREAAAFLRAQTTSGHHLHTPQPRLDAPTYRARIKTVLELIRAGDIYQANFTFPLDLQLDGDPVSLYTALRARQRVAHGALIYTGETSILSLSPELFFECQDGLIRTRPMKGTVRRGRDSREDDSLARWLRADPKSRAENLMIVDLLRNDLGRVARIGSVRVPDLFMVEHYPTFHAMTSTVEARPRDAQSAAALLRALFPCGSVTGAPKIRAMEVIRDLEMDPRGVYTGAIGAFAPDGSARFNVSIRTMTIDAHGRGVMGIGSGIVADSDPQAEYEECLLKARFLMAEAEAYSLIETMAAQQGQVPMLDGHMARLTRSAHWHGFSCDHAAIKEAILQAAQGQARAKLRLLLRRDGQHTLTVTPLSPHSPAPLGPAPLRFIISDETIDAADPIYVHKTTRRAFYDAAHAAAVADGGCDEVLFLNDWGTLAEGSRSTLFVEKDGILVTPPCCDGALPGVLRAHLLADPSRPVTECSLTRHDLHTADRLYLANAVWGLRAAILVDHALRADAPEGKPNRQTGT